MPESPTTTYREAMAEGDWDRAIALLERKAGAGADDLSPDEAFALAELYELRGDPRRAAAILDRFCTSAEPAVAAEALVRLSGTMLAGPRSALADAEALLSRAGDLARADRRLNGLIAHARSRLVWRRGEFREAGTWLEDARRMLEEAGDEVALARVLDGLANFHEHHGDRKQAIACYLLSLSKKALSRDLYGIAVTLGNLGRLYLRMHEPALALSCLRDDLKIAERIGDLRAQVVVKVNIGQALTALKRTDEAVATLEEAFTVARARGWREQEAYARKDLACAFAARGENERAFAFLEDALASVADVPIAYPRGQILLALGDLLLASADLDRARDTFTEARRIFADLGARHEEAVACAQLARIGERRQQWDTSWHYFAEGIKCVDPFASTIMPELGDLFQDLQRQSPDRPPRIAIGPYRLESRIGAGAYAEVYRAYREGDPSKAAVAVKCLRPGEPGRDAESRLARFQRECEALRRVEHPNVVRLIDHGEDRGPYIAMEFIEGGDLRRLIHPDEPLPIDRAVSILGGVARGLVALHEHGIVHRDLKPANILLRDGEVPVIADFGTARVVDLPALTIRGTVMGTLAYMAPEQRRGEFAGEAADIFALGVIAYQLLTGRLPPDVAMIGGCPEPPDPAAIRPAIPSAISDWVRSCLTADPAKRCAVARDVLAGLERAAAEAVRARTRPQL